MARKLAEYVVIDGCIQARQATFIKGEFYVPASKEQADELVADGVIAESTSVVGKAVLAATGRVARTSKE